MNRRFTSSGLPRTGLTPCLLAAAAGLVGMCSTASAQTAWLAAASGNWTDAARWTAGVPVAGAATTLGLAGPYTTTLQNATGNTGTLTVSNSTAILSVFDNANLNVDGNISNSGLIQISGPGAPGNTTRLTIAATNVTYSGSGTLRLAALSNGDNVTGYITYAAPANTLTNSAGALIAGKGQIYARISNVGTINADQAGTGIFFIDQPKVNNGTITASNGGLAQFRSVALTQGTNGVLLSSNSSPVQINNTTVTGGTLNGAGTSSGIQYFGTSTLESVTLSNLNAVTDNSVVNVTAGGAINNGTWTVSSPTAPGNATRIQAAAPAVTIGGTGTLRLQGIQGGNGDNVTAYLYYTAAGNVLTNGPSHSIRGYGQVYTNLVNNGSVNADISGKGLFMIEQPKTNNGTMTASNGGFLQFRSVTVTGNPTAQIISTDAASPVQMVNATMTGGGFNTSGTGRFEYFQTNTLSNLTVNGTHQITDNTLVNLNTNLVNNGTWLISTPTAAGNLTRLSANAAAVTISGTGTIRLQGIQGGNGDNDTAYLTYGAAGNVLTLGSGQQLLGYGRVYTNLVNNGTITADNPNLTATNSRGLFFIDQPKTNNGTMTASNGGFLQFRSVTVTGNPTAQIISTDAASPVQMVNATMTGGGFTTSGTGQFQYFQTNTLSNLTVNGTHQVTDNTNVNLNTNLVNNGNWLISTPTAAGNLTRITANAAAVTISGTGTIRLQGIQGGNGDNDTAYLYYGSAANVLTLGSGQQLLGYGRVYTNLVNNGIINADNTPNASGPASKGIILMEQPKTNNGTITSSNAGFWYIRGTTLTNNGTLTSTNTTTPGGGFESCTVNGGTISNVSNQFFGTVFTVNLNGVTIPTGSGIQVNDNSNLVTTGLTNNGTIRVQNIGGAGNLTRITAANNANATINGTGTIRLQATGFSSDTSYLQGPTATGQNLTVDAGQTLTGTGRLFNNVIINGTVSPDKPFGTPDAWGSIQPFSGTLTFGTTSTFNAQIRSTSQFDSMQGNSAIVINGGTLNVSFDPAYVPTSQDRFDIIRGASVTGRFTTINLVQPPAYAGGQAHVAYLADRVSVIMCYANCDGSSVSPALSPADFTCFLNRYRAGDPYANCDQSTGTPALSPADFTCFLNKYRNGCGAI